MPRSTNQFAFTNWDSAKVLNDLLTAVQSHFDDAKQGDRANKQIIAPETDQLTESCIEALRDLGVTEQDIFQAVNRLYDAVAATA